MLPSVISALLLVGGTFAVPVNPRARIINGTDASIEDFPFMISLRSYTGSHSCGGSIVSKKWIMTAAHCVNNSTTPFLQTIQVGRSNISKPEDSSVYKISKVIIHPGYSPENSYVNDIAVFQLVGELEFSDYVQPVQLPEACFEVDADDSGVTLIGWGLTDDGVVPSTLQKVNYYVVPNYECNDIHSSATIHSSQICAAYPGGGKGQCSGDSGGPLLHNDVQVGVVSWSIKPCTVAPYPGVLTKVSHHLPFIYENTDLDSTGVDLRYCLGF
ncbi:trypsin-7-like [Uranotaenia lowii]|uniref:trypsin-7-like n=1 Tax=Uranotaenia lowii TaxID=190385 RepID=UPI0024793CDA|nr:trypsin-7-like [Uranotaenia lowii]